MFSLKNLKTPHRLPMRHFVLMLCYFFVFTSLAFGFNDTQAHSRSLIAALAAIVLSGLFSLAGGTLFTMLIRSAFGLIQTGRVIQYLGFWLATSGSLVLFQAAFLTPISWLYALFSGFCVFSLVFLTATISGEVPWRGRTWLPMKRKTRTL